MSLWNHPRLTAALCTVAVLGCAAAPAVFLAAADAASLGRVETVADPYVAPTPTADDYYILRQLAARSRNAESEREQRPAEVLTAPKMYIGASASLQSMQYADSAAAIQPLPSPSGEGGPAGPDEGQAPAAALSRANRRGRRPRRPAKPPANNHPPGNTPRRGQDPSLRTEPLTPAYANPRAGHARPLPRGGPETGAHVNPTAFPYPPIRGAGCPHPAATFRHRPFPGKP